MKRITGKDIDLPAVADLQIIRSQHARRITWHSHEGCQILFVLRGATAYEVKHPAPGELDLPGGHFLVIPAGVAHRGIHNVRPPCALFSILLGGSGRRALRNLSLTPGEWKLVESRLCDAPPASRPVSPELRRLVAALSREVQAWSQRRLERLSRARLRTLICETLVEVDAQIAKAGVVAPGNVVVAAQRYFREHLGDSLNIRGVARQLGVSRGRLFELFKRGVGMAPHDFLLRTRIEKAGELLAKTKRQVTDIAYATGFGSSQYFSTVFRKFTGLTPVEYREELSGIVRTSAKSGS